MAATAPPHNTDAGARCVVLVGGGAVPSNLVAALDERGITATIARTAPEVMTELADGGVASVVVVEPERQARAAELHDAAGTYHPGVRFWSYAPQAPGREARLSVFNLELGETLKKSGTAVNPWYPPTYGEQDASGPAALTSDSNPEFFAPAGQPEAPGPEGLAENLSDDQAVVSEQELEMLLESEFTPTRKRSRGG